MPPELIAGILGPIVGAVFGVIGFSSRRNISTSDAQLQAIAESVEVISLQVTNIQIQLPTKYASKDDLASHTEIEERWHKEMLHELREIREEVIVLRVNKNG